MKGLNKIFLAAVAMLILITVTAVIDGRDDVRMTNDEMAPFSQQYWLGTNDLGQDLLKRVWLATPGSLLIALGTGLVATVIALSYALLMTISQEKTRQVLLRIIDIQLAFPSLLLAILVAAYLQPSTFVLLLLLIALEWPKEVREMYVVSSLEIQRDSVFQARRYGANIFYLLRRHLLPRLLPNIIGIGVNVSRRALLHASGLAFLGVTDPSKPTWGGMIADVIPLLYIPESITLIVAPSLALIGLMSLLTLGGYLLEKQVVNLHRAN